MRSAPPFRQRGVAVVLAILIVALAAIIAVRIFWQQRAWGDAIHASGAHLQRQAYAHAGLLWVRTLLRDDAARSSVDHLQELWATPLPLTVIQDGVEMGGEIVDQQGLFNLNNLVGDDGTANPRMIQVYHGLLGQLGLPGGLAVSLADWMDKDGIRLADGEREDDSYLEGVPPALPGNQRLRELEDLRFVSGYSNDVIRALRPFVAVLPRQTQVNVNTAPEEVLMAYIGGLRREEARFIADTRKVYFKDRKDFLARLPRSGEIGLSELEFDVASRYFLLRSVVRADSGVIESHSLLERFGANTPTVVWEKFE